MAQAEHSDNLDRWANPAHRLVTLILIRSGLRVTDALRLTPAGGPPPLDRRRSRLSVPCGRDATR